MACTPKVLRQNLYTAMERKRKIARLLDEWYQEAAQVNPPPATGPSILFYNTKVSYYYTSEIQDSNIILNQVNAKFEEAVKEIPEVTSLPSNDIANLVLQSITGTTPKEISQGGSTFVSQTFEGKFKGKRCLYRPIIFAISFTFPNAEYNTPTNVALFGYSVYLSCIEPPLGPEEVENKQFRSIDGELIEFQFPPDKQIVGRRYMTLEELDNYHLRTISRVE